MRYGEKRIVQWALALTVGFLTANAPTHPDPRFRLQGNAPELALELDTFRESSGCVCGYV